MATTPLSCVVDNRERELIPLLHPWPVRALPVGDIWIGLSGEEIGVGGLVIERKSTNDFEASILDGRYREQRTRLTAYCQAQGARPLYIIEGPLDRIWGTLTQSVLEKHLNRLLLKYGVAVIHTDSIDDTARRVKELAEQLQETPACFVPENPAAVPYASTISVTKRGNKEDPKQFASAALQACPGVSATIADAILTALGGSLEAVFAADPASIEVIAVGQKRRVGPKLAERLYALLHGHVPS